MKVMYQAPDIKLVEFDVEGKLMDDGYDNGDIFVNPWAGDESAQDTLIDGQ